MTLENAYLSAVIVAHGLARLEHPQAELAAQLKDVVGRAVSHPELVREPEFSGLWAQRGTLAGLPLEGELGGTITRHAALLAGMSL